MNAISLHQPWASAMALGLKTIETRSWKPPAKCIGERFVIASTQRGRAGDFGDYTVEDDTPRRSAKQYLMRGPMAWPYRLPLGCIVASGVLTNAVPIESVIFYANTRQMSGLAWFDNPAEGEDARWVEADGTEREWGDFSPGRWAWLFSELEPVNPPIPCKGKQRVWQWEPVRTQEGEE